MTLGFFVLILLLIVSPFLIGMLLNKSTEPSLMTMVKGYFVSWSFFFVIAVFAVLTGMRLEFVIKAYMVVTGCLSISGIFSFFMRGRKNKHVINGSGRLSRYEMIYLSCFIGIILFQLYKTLFFAYADGDDAFYIATSQDIYNTGYLYNSLPYSGTFVGDERINFRYALSPLPVWIATLGKISGIPITIISFDIIPCVFLVITYTIYNEIGKMIFKKDREKRYLFLLIISIFVMFSNVSTMTAETFMLTRARQGKEALANIVIPYMFLTIGSIVSKEKSDGETDSFVNFKDVIMLLTGCVSAALMSVFGNILMLIMMFVFFCFLLFIKRNIKSAVTIGFIAVFNILVSLIYIVKG